MIIVVPTLLIGVLALYGINAVLKATNFKTFIQEHKIGWITLGLVFVALMGLYFTSDFKSESEKQLMSQIMQIQDPNQKAAFEAPARDLVNAIADDRKGFIESDCILTHLLIYQALHTRNNIHSSDWYFNISRSFSDQCTIPKTKSICRSCRK
jgi:hypothetical protein